ncbi:MAG: O-methyltransferase [Candidatus Omnitrophica bacterium]|nr:O-methyltransferase [Candidatus Omnitrophota bacterium]
MELVNPRVEDYIASLYTVSDPVLKEMEKLARRLDFPYVGPMVGQLLFQLAKLAKAKTVFEMGSGFGYSAYWFAKALPSDGRVHHTDTDPDNCEQAKDFFKRGGLEKKVTVHAGDALNIIDEVPGDFDIIFIDAAKEDYPACFKKAKARLNKGGLLIADNCLWFGQVFDKNPDPPTRGILEFTRLVFSDKELVATLVPIRDGLIVALKA